MLKMTHFLYFLLMIAIKPVTVWVKYLSTPERYPLAPTENAMGK